MSAKKGSSEMSAFRAYILNSTQDAKVKADSAAKKVMEGTKDTVTTAKKTTKEVVQPRQLKPRLLQRRPLLLPRLQQRRLLRPPRPQQRRPPLLPKRQLPRKLLPRPASSCSSPARAFPMMLSWTMPRLHSSTPDTKHPRSRPSTSTSNRKSPWSTTSSMTSREASPSDLDYSSSLFFRDALS